MIKPIKTVTAKELMEMSKHEVIALDVEAGKHSTWVTPEDRNTTRKKLEASVQDDCFSPYHKDETKGLYDSLKRWINTNLIPVSTIYQEGSTSYGLKHLFERSEDGIYFGNRYVTNNTFKAAMIDCGFWYLSRQQFEADDQIGNLYFNISKKSPAFKEV